MELSGRTAYTILTSRRPSRDGKTPSVEPAVTHPAPREHGAPKHQGRHPGEKSVVPFARQEFFGPLRLRRQPKRFHGLRRLRLHRSVTANGDTILPMHTVCLLSFLNTLETE